MTEHYLFPLFHYSGRDWWGIPVNFRGNPGPVSIDQSSGRTADSSCHLPSWAWYGMYVMCNDDVSIPISSFSATNEQAQNRHNLLRLPCAAPPTPYAYGTNIDIVLLLLLCMPSNLIYPSLDGPGGQDVLTYHANPSPLLGDC